VEDAPRWCLSNFEFDNESASIAIRCNGKLFFVDVSAEDLGDWWGKQEFLQLLQDVSDDQDAERSPYDFISGPCLPLLRTYVPVVEDTDSFTPEKHYAPEIFFFNLVGDGNGIKAIRYPEEHTKTAKISTQIALSEIPDSSKVLHLDVSTIRILPGDDPGADTLSDNPSIVTVSRGRPSITEHSVLLGTFHTCSSVF
jgi:hypothetical protein